MNLAINFYIENAVDLTRSLCAHAKSNELLPESCMKIYKNLKASDSCKTQVLTAIKHLEKGFFHVEQNQKFRVLRKTFWGYCD